MHTTYMCIMSGIVIIVTAIAAPSLFWPGCHQCNHRNWVERKICKQCGCDLQDHLDL